MKKQVKQQRRAWVRGESIAPPVKLSHFEVKCKRLHINPDNTSACAASPVLRTWVQRWLDQYYVPEALLKALKLTTTWDQDITTPYSLGGTYQRREAA